MAGPQYALQEQLHEGPQPLRWHCNQCCSIFCCAQVYAPEKLHVLMAESDYIVAAMPFTPATHKLIDAEAIRCMKKTGVLINVGRGQTIDESALIQGEERPLLLYIQCCH